MKCDHCDNPATVHEVTIQNGARVEKHLCESCAKKEGLSPGMQTPIALANFVVAHPAQADASQPVCPRCGLKWSGFRQHGLFGCPSCYESFAQLLLPLLERAQDGASEHVGKAPRRAGRDVVKQQQVRRLRKELTAALEAEQYERAAEIRDALRDMGVVNGVGRPRGCDPGAARGHAAGSASSEASSDAGDSKG